MPVFLRHRTLSDPNETPRPDFYGSSNVVLVTVIAPELMYGADTAMLAQKLSATLALDRSVGGEDALPTTTRIAMVSRDGSFIDAGNGLTRGSAADESLAGRIVLVDGSNRSGEELAEQFGAIVTDHVHPWSPRPDQRAGREQRPWSRGCGG